MPKLNNVKEFRVFNTELRVAPDAKPIIEGYAALYNVQTDLGYFQERIAPGAFARAISEKDDVRCLLNHDSNALLGRTTNGTLTLSQDSTGLKMRCELPDTSVGKDVHTLITRGDITGMSFGFMVLDEDVSYTADGRCLRTIKDVSLLDVSPCVYPAYEATSVQARSIDAAKEAYKPEPPAPAFDPLVRAKLLTRLRTIS
jgi:HK97 family phage prohead protease